MPVAKVLPIRSAKALSGKIAYLCDKKHPNHTDKIVEPAYCHRIENSAEFLAKTVSTIRALNARRKRGRKIRNLADEIIVRSPDLANLTPEECSLFVKFIIADVCDDSPCYVVWHRDKFTGAADLHILAANFIDAYPPKVRRSSSYSPITVARASSDRVTEIINSRRRQEGVPTVITMQEVRRNKLKLRSLSTLAEQLRPMLPFTAADLPEMISAAGYKVTRFNAQGNTVSVLLADGKKPYRFYIDKLMLETGSLGGGAAASAGRDIAGISNEIKIS
jgi:hypothetical protein